MDTDTDTDDHLILLVRSLVVLLVVLIVWVDMSAVVRVAVAAAELFLLSRIILSSLVTLVCSSAID